MPLMFNRLDTIGNYIEVPGDEMVVTYSGVFSFKYIYYLLHEWFVENKYCSPDEQNFREILYAQRDSQAGKEIFAKWRLTKENSDHYFHKFEIDLIMHTLALSPTEVLVDGKKMKLDKGEVEFKFHARIRKNPAVDNAWFMKSPILKKWMENKHFLSRRDEAYKDFFSDLEKLRDAIKEYFDIESYLKNRQLLEYYKGRMGQ